MNQAVRALSKALEIGNPDVFDREAPEPLALDIHLELRKEFPKASRKTIRKFLWWWCRRGAYLRVISRSKPGRMRVDINGKPAGLIDAGARAKAKEELKIPYPRWKFNRRKDSHVRV